MDDIDSQEIIEETPAENTFIAPSISEKQLLANASYTYHSRIPSSILADKETECVLGIDEAGRGPVLGPMVYGLFYLPTTLHHSLLADTHHFDDSKVLTPAVRSNLLKKLCTPSTDLFENCGWATRVLSARDIGANMLKPAVYNLNAQAMDATIMLVQEVLDAGVNVKEVYVDTVGKPEIYQPASVCAKVTRDAALETSYKALSNDANGTSAEGWGSGYPSDARCVSWLKGNLDPVFGWGGECRFSWGTAKDLLEKRELARKVDWPEENGADGMAVLSEYFRGSKDGTEEMAEWWGQAAEEIRI